MTPETKAEIAALVVVRPVTADDLPFIRDAWKNAAYKHLEASLWSSGHARKPAWAVWSKLFPNIIERILTRADARVVCSKEKPDQILAFGVAEQLEDGTRVLHWVSTKKKLWRHGLAELLLRELGFDTEKPAVYSFASSAHVVLKERVKAWEYVPFWLFAL